MGQGTSSRIFLRRICLTCQEKEYFNRYLKSDSDLNLERGTKSHQFSPNIILIQEINQREFKK